MPLELTFGPVMPSVTLFRNFDERQPVEVHVLSGQTFKDAVTAWLVAQDDATACDGLTYGRPELGRYLATLRYNEGMEADDELWTVETAHAGDYGWQTAYYTEQTDTWDAVSEVFAKYVGYCESTSYSPLGEEPSDNDYIW